jgi:hypothetical protein
MTHFESVLSLNTTEQGSFKIQGQIEAARLHIQHPIINEAVEIVSQLDGFIDRRKLIEIWSTDYSIGAKIVVTNWWGGISHFNRPRFYSDENMKTLNSLSSDVLKGLNDDNPEELISRFLPRGDLYLQGIGVSFFTKYFQFSTQASNSAPFIIADKWTLIAVMADAISQKVKVPWLFVNTRNRTVSFSTVDASSYLEFNAYFVNRAKKLEVSPFFLEEKVFGWRGSRNQQLNPRRMGKDMIF